VGGGIVVANIKVGHLAAAHATGIEEFEYRAVAQSAPIGGSRWMAASRSGRSGGQGRLPHGRRFLIGFGLSGRERRPFGGRTLRRG
jgi:hypothetical protein